MKISKKSQIPSWGTALYGLDEAWYSEGLVVWLNAAREAEPNNYAYLMRLLHYGRLCEQRIHPERRNLNSSNIRELQEAILETQTFHDELNKCKFNPTYTPYSGQKIQWECMPDKELLPSKLVIIRGRGDFRLGTAVTAVLKLLSDGNSSLIKQCDHCEQWMILARSDGRFCSKTCRITAYATAPDYNERVKLRMRAHREAVKRKNRIHAEWELKRRPRAKK
jgi:hypothetical protein